jgi:CheY-like chemotaxis protein
MQTFQLAKFLNSSLAGHRKYAQLKNIEFTLVTDFIFDITLSADKRKIKSLLSDALKSTIDHSGATSIIFSIRQLLRSGHGILLEFSLETNGSVAASAEKFSYFRSLVANRHLIEELNGKSEFIVSPNSGSIFKFVMGFTLAEPENDSCNYEQHLLKERKVLVVDDNEINRTSLVQFLEDQGVECTQACNGLRAIELLEKNNFYDLILLDILMPQMDGFETAAYIRKKLKNNIPILAIPARNKIWIPLQCKKVGIDNFINKPLVPDQLLNLMNSMMEPGNGTGSIRLLKIA